MVTLGTGYRKTLESSTRKGHAPTVLGSTPSRRDPTDLRRRPPALGLSCLLGAASFLVYALTASPYAGFDDVAEFQTLSVTRGIAHAGYPLYLVCLESFQALAPGTVAYGANLFSGLAAALAVALLVWIGTRRTGCRLGGLAAAAVLAGSYAHWFNATHAEVYAFTLALSLGGLAAHMEYESSRRGPMLFCTGLLLGAALGSHLSSLALAGALGAAILLAVARGLAPVPHLAWLGAGGLLGLSPLLLIPLRDTPANAMHYVQYTFHPHVPGFLPWDPSWGTRLARAASLLSGAQFLEHGWFHPFEVPLYRLRLLALDLVGNELFGPATLLAIAGAWRALWRGALNRLLLLWGALLLVLLLYAANPLLLADFFLPGVAILALFAGGACADLARRVGRTGHARLAAWAGGTLVPLLVLFPLARTRLAEPPLGLAARPLVARVWQAWPKTWDPFAPDASWERYAREALAVLPRGALVLHGWEEGTTFLYGRYALGLRPDVTHSMVGSATHGEALVREGRERRAAVYTTMPKRRQPASVEWELAGQWERGELWRAVESPEGAVF